MAYIVDIKRLGVMTLFDLKGAPASLNDWCGDNLPAFPAPNTAAFHTGHQLLHIGRNHWLLLAEFDREAELEAALAPAKAPADISIVRISDTLCFFQITGPDADQILSIASPLDVHATVFPENGATFTEIFGLKALVIRRPNGFWLAVEQSFGDMLEDYLTRATS